MLKTFIVSFQICDMLFVIFTMTSLGSRKRPFRHRVRCEVCQKQLNSDNKESHIKAKHHGKRVKFSIVRDSKQSQLHFKLTSPASSNPNTSSITAKTGTESVNVGLQDQSRIVEEVAEPGMHSKIAENSQEVSDDEIADLTSPVSSNLNTSSITSKTRTESVNVNLQDQNRIIEEVAEPCMHSKTAENSQEVSDKKWQI